MYMEPSNVYISDKRVEEEAIQWPLRPGEPTNTLGWIQQRSSAPKKRCMQERTPRPSSVLRTSRLLNTEKNRLVLQATERFLKSGIEIKNVYGSLVG